MSASYAIGLLIGVIVGLVVAALLIRYMNRDKKWKTRYDEMQQKIRGKAYCYAFYTIMILEAIMIFVSLFEIRLPMTDAVMHFTIIVIGVLWNAAMLSCRVQNPPVEIVVKELQTASYSPIPANFSRTASQAVIPT